MSIKSLKARLAKIPEPDLSRLRQQRLYEKLKLVPYDLREEWRQKLREKLKADAVAMQQQEARGETVAAPVRSKTSAEPPQSSAGVERESPQYPPPDPRPKG